MFSLAPKQIQHPGGHNIFHQRAVSSGDHSFDADADGKYIYCFSNEHWSAATKEVSFNVHGIVYVPESEAPQDPLEIEGSVLPFSRLLPLLPQHLQRPVKKCLHQEDDDG